MGLAKPGGYLLGLFYFSALISSGDAVAADAGQAVGAANQGQADTSLEEIVVTAQRRQQLLQDVPITITNLSADDMTSADVVQLSDIARLTPALHFDSTTNFVQPYIRGIGTAVAASGSGSNVGIYVDGFYVPNPLTSNFDLLEVKSVEVLKGPQGTLFGRNTTGGAILVTTADPSTQTSGVAEASYGTFNTETYRGYITTGLTDSIAVDLEGQYRKSNGYITNIINGDSNIGRSESWTVRNGLKIDLSETLSVLLRYTHSFTSDPVDSLADPFVQSNGQTLVFKPLLGSGLYATGPGLVARGANQPIGFQSTTDVVQVTVRDDLGFANLTSYTQYRNETTAAFNDFSFSAANIFIANLRTKDETTTQELLLTSKEGSPLQWTAGAFYFQNPERWDFALANSLPPTPILANNTNPHTAAVYGDLTYAITPQFFVTAGARYSYDTVINAWFTSTTPATFGERFYIPNYNSNAVTPRLVVRYKPTEESSVYASFTRGYKAGLLNVGGQEYTPVSPEHVSAYEVGYKYAGPALSYGVSAFYYDYKDLQVSTYFSTSALISNAATSAIYGADGEARYKFVNGFEVNAGAAYTKAEYKTYDGASSYSQCPDTLPCAGTFEVTPVNIRNGVMQDAPEITANIGARYPIVLPVGRLAFSGNLYYTSHFYFDTSEQFAQPAYTVLALRAEWTDPSNRYTVAAYGNNVTNTRYRTELFANTYGIGTAWNAPVTYGVTLGLKF